MAKINANWKSIAIAGLLHLSLTSAGDEGGYGSKSSCWPVTTTSTVYSVSTSYIEKYVEKTVWSTNIIYITDTATKIQVVPTTIVNVNTVPVPTTITDTVTSVLVSNVASPPVTVSFCPPGNSPPVGLVTCTSRIINPTYTPPAPLPSSYLWGCPPGKICTPPQIDCNFEQNPPAESYVCAPQECKPIPEITVPEDFNLTSLTNPSNADCAWYKPNPGLFNINPEFFGLTFAIFDIYGQPVCPATPAYLPPPPTTTTSGWQDWPAPTHSYTPRMIRRRLGNPLAEIMSRQSLAIAPSACYSSFNKASLLAQLIGKVYPLLCPDTSEFKQAVQDCRSCASNNSATETTTDNFPVLQEYFLWCQENTPTK